MEQVAWVEISAKKNFTMSDKLLDYMKSLKTDINAMSTSRIPQLLSAVDSDVLILRPLATSPDESSRFMGLQAKLNMFMAFPMNSGRWTWNSDLALDTTHTPPSPAPPASATYACGSSPDMSTCSQGAAPSETSSADTTLTTPSVSSTTFACPPDQVMSCAQVGMGAHAFSSCACVVMRESTSVINTTQTTMQATTQDTTQATMEATTPSVSSTTSPCPSDQVLTCGQIERGPHTYSSCACVMTRESTSVMSTTEATKSSVSTARSSCPPNHVVTCGQVGMGEYAFSSCACVATQTTWTTTTVFACPSGHTSTCIKRGLSLHAYPSCACVLATEPPSPPAPPVPSLSPPLASPSPLLPQSPESGTISMPDFVTTCRELRVPLASYTLCPRDQSWVKVAEYSSVQGREGNS